MSDTRQQLHELIDEVPAEQLETVAGVLKVILHPVARALASAPPDDEPVTEEDWRRLQEGRIWFEQHGGKGIPMEDVLAEFGLKLEDFPLPSTNHK